MTVAAIRARAAHEQGALGRLRPAVLATTVNYIDRQILSLIKELLDHDLGWTNEQFGLVNSAFQGAYAVGLARLRMVRRSIRNEDRIRRLDLRLESCRHVSLRWSLRERILRRTRSSRHQRGRQLPLCHQSRCPWFPKRERAFRHRDLQLRRERRSDHRSATIPAIASLSVAISIHPAGIAGLIWLPFWFRFYEIPGAAQKRLHGRDGLIRSDTDEDHSGGTPMGWRRALGPGRPGRSSWPSF